jgi:hypothetical protein
LVTLSFINKGTIIYFQIYKIDRKVQQIPWMRSFVIQ